MATKLEHNTGSAVATTGWETAKGGLMGWVVAGIVGAVVLGGIAAIAVGGAGLIAGALFPGVASVAAGAFSTAGAALSGTVGGLLIAGAAAVGGFLGLTTPAGPIAGAVVGFFKGTRRVGAENRAAARSIEIRSNAAGQQMAAVAQQSYAAGVRDDRISMMQQLHDYHDQVVQAEQLARAQANPAGIGMHSAKIRQQQAAASGVQLA